MKADNKKKYEVAHKLIMSGMKGKDAFVKAGIKNNSNYYNWRKNNGGARKAGKLVELPDGTTDKVIMFVGSPEAVAAVARGMQ